MKRVSILAMGCILVIITFGGVAFAGHGTINLNTATVQELQMLDGITEAVAQNIIEFRNMNGPFTSLDDLMKVNGMNRTLLDDVKPFLKLQGDTDFRIEDYRPGTTHGEAKD